MVSLVVGLAFDNHDNKNLQNVSLSHICENILS